MFVNILKYFTLISLMSLFGFSVYAEGENIDIDYDNITSSSVELSWTGSEDIFFYKINYGTTSGDGKEDYTPLLDGTEYIFDDLLENTTYYFTVSGYNELGNEGYLTNELTINTLSKEVENKGAFYLEEANMIGKNKIELTFSNPLSKDESNERVFGIENISDSSDFYDIETTEISEISDNRLVITLDGEPIVGEEYNVIALAITDKYDQNIESGVDLDATFVGIEIIEEEIIEEEVDLYSAEALDELVESVVEVGTETGIGGVELNAADVENNIVSIAEDNSNLPKTGPEQLLIFILAFILSALIFVFKFKKA